MYHKILADESLDFRIVKKLRQEGFDVISVLEKYRSIPDKKVLELTKESNAILLTEDSDFGEWIFSHKEKGVGIIFLRYKPNDIERILNSLIHVLNKYKDTLSNKFTVIKANKIRLREI
ncbi:MAG: DUF5615 family PIN-like protein [Candidatus Brocadiales bacterium]